MRALARPAGAARRQTLTGTAGWKRPLGAAGLRRPADAAARAIAVLRPPAPVLPLGMLRPTGRERL